MRMYKVRSIEDLTGRIAEKDGKLAAIICRAILDNLETTKKNIYVVTIELEEDEESYDLSCMYENFLFTLEQNLKVLEYNEQYELCAEVLEGIKKLKQNSYDKDNTTHT
jgi:hypothetical protein